MPLYDMQCKVCGNEFERACDIDERNAQRCPRCGETASVLVICLGSKMAWDRVVKQQLSFPPDTTRWK